MLTVVVDEKVKVERPPAETSRRMVTGSPAQIADQVQTKVLDTGIDGVIMNLSAHGHSPA